MKHEFWAEFDLYKPLAKKGKDIHKLRQRINKIKQQLKQSQDRQKKRLLQKQSKHLQTQLNNTQEESQSTIANFIFSGETQMPFDPAARQTHLAQLLAVDCICEGRTTQCKDYAKGKNGLQRWYYAGNLENPKGKYQTFLAQRLRWTGTVLGLVNHEDTMGPALPNLSHFPPGSWAIQIHFTLRKPYLSKDDVDFYIIDNPVKKEWVFKVPYVAPSQWKGALRSAMMKELVDDLRSEQKDDAEFTQERLRLYRLFGNEKDGIAHFLNRALTLHRVGPQPTDEHQMQEWEQKYKHTYEQVAREFEEKVRTAGYRKENVEGLQGRLHFYPTFFDRIGLEVINPHDRKTGAGKNPIYFECVPAGASGVFTLLYVPLGAGPIDEETCKADLAAVSRGVRAMLTEYGFGAKTSSGYGVVEDEVKDGMVKINLPDVFKASPPTAQPSTDYAPPEEAFLKYLDEESGEVKAAFKGSGEGGLMSNREYKQRGESQGGSTLSEFKRFRDWYVAHGDAWKAAHHTQEPSGSEKPPTSQKDFETLSALSELANSLQADAMATQREGGENG